MTYLFANQYRSNGSKPIQAFTHTPLTSANLWLVLCAPLAQIVSDRISNHVLPPFVALARYVLAVLADYKTQLGLVVHRTVLRYLGDRDRLEWIGERVARFQKECRPLRNYLDPAAF